MDEASTVRFKRHRRHQYMFCSDRISALKVAWHGGRMSEPEGAPGSSFIAYTAMPSGEPDEHCWVVDWGATRVEIEQRGTVHTV